MTIDLDLDPATFAQALEAAATYGDPYAQAILNVIRPTIQEIIDAGNRFAEQWRRERSMTYRKIRRYQRQRAMPRGVAAVTGGAYEAGA